MSTQSQKTVTVTELEATPDHLHELAKATDAELAAKKNAKTERWEELMAKEGWKFLPGGIEREIRVRADCLAYKYAAPFYVTEDGELQGDYFEVKVLEGSSLTRHLDGVGCGRGSASIVTTSPLLVKTQA